MYLELKNRLEARLRDVLKAKYDLDIENIPLETPPELKFGELATPLAFELARKLRKAPKVIAQEIVAAVGEVEGFAGFEVAGAGYINARLDRAVGVQSVAATGTAPLASSGIHALVEHTSINPNKAAHVGHLRNAILGDTFVRLLRAAGQRVTVQNYIDNTGVQVADVVVALMHINIERPLLRSSSGSSNSRPAESELTSNAGTFMRKYLGITKGKVQPRRPAGRTLGGRACMISSGETTMWLKSQS